MNVKIVGALAAASLMALLSVSARAGPVAVGNSSFESPVVATFNTGPITDFQIGDTGGLFNNAAGVYTAPDGQQVGYAGQGNGVIGHNDGVLFQYVGPVTPLATYTLTVDVGRSLSSPANDYRLLLGYGGHDESTATIFAAAVNPVLVAPGTFSFASLTGTAPAGASGNLVFFLENSGAFGVATQTAFDDVSLVSNVPEPATWAMLLIGFGGLGAMARGSRRKQAAALAA